MQFRGQVLKMSSVLSSPIQYYLNLTGDLININQLFGRILSIRHTGFQCVSCGKDLPIFRMGFCKKCFFESPYASETIIRPELSTAHLDIEERDIEVEREIQLQPHIVYLAYTGDVKVGVTRESQVPTRWIDQGATLALPIAKTNNRYEAGMIEVALKEHLADKTNYRKMLMNEHEEVDLSKIRDEMKAHIPQEFQQFYLGEEALLHLDFPYKNPEKVNVFSLDKTPEFTGVLKGIKGQYLCFEGDNFFNVRGHEGFVIELEVRKEG